MKIIIRILFFSLILGQISFAQWERMGGPGSLNTVSVVIQGEELYAGTSINGVFRSIDFGSTWIPVNNGLPTPFIKVVAISDTFIFAGTSNYGVYRSTNKGLSWTAANNGLTDLYVQTFLITEHGIYMGTINGIFYSSNYGENWVSRMTGITGNVWIRDFAASDSTLYAATLNDIYVSTNKGLSWAALNTNLGKHILCVESVGATLFAGTNQGGIFRSTDKGLNWSSANTGLNNKVIYSFAASGNYVYAGASGIGNVYRSSNNGESWSPSNEFPSTAYVLSLAVSGANIFAATEYTGIYYSSNYGADWSNSNRGLIETTIESMMLLNDHIYVKDMIEGKWYFSTDYGRDWNTMSLPANYFNGISISNSNIFIGTTNGIYLSTNNGADWVNILNREPEELLIEKIYTSGTNILAVEFGLEDFGEIFYSSNFGSTWNISSLPLHGTGVNSVAFSGTYIFLGTIEGMFYSADNGLTWTDGNNGLTNTDIRCLATSGNKIYAGTFGNGVFYSSNDILNWTPVNNGLTNQHIHSMYTSGNKLFAGTGEGVFLSTDEAASWSAINEGGLQNLVVYSVVNSDTYIFTGTWKDGVWRRPLSDIVSAEGDPTLPEKFKLVQNYPNPFNPSTTIEFNINKASDVKLQIYDIKGSLVKTVVSGYMNAGHHKVIWDGTNENGIKAASGIYMYRLNSGEMSENKKMIILK